MTGRTSGPVAGKAIPHGGLARGTVAAPASKSVTQRALIAAAIAVGRSSIRRPLLAGDNLRLIEAFETLGIAVTVRQEATKGEPVVEVTGCGGRIAAPRATIQVGNAGTTMRFLTALLAFGDGDYLIDGDARMRRRPIDDLLAALRDLGARAVAVNDDGCPPVRVGGGSPPGGGASSRAAAGPVNLRGDRSSQFLSALLLAGPAASGGVDIAIEGPLVSRPYVDLTVAVLRRFGVEVRCDPPGREARRFRVAAGSVCRATDFLVEGDWSSASYFFAAAAITGGEVTVSGIDPDSAQGDARFLGLLERMGCAVERRADGVTVRGGPTPGGPSAGVLRGIDADCAEMPDIVPTLAVVALFADRPTRITGVPHLRIKETDRIAALVAEIRRLGGEAVEAGDGLTIAPRLLRGARVETYDDHRMAMAFAVAGLRVPGVVIADPGCVSKSFPEFWDRFESILQKGREA